MSTVTVFNRTNEALTQEFEELFREHSLMVYRTAYAVTGNPQDAEDVLQSVFLWLLRRGIPAGLKNNPGAYLYRAAVNSSLNSVRSRQRRERNADVDRLESFADPAVQADAPNAEEEDQRRLVAAMAQLNTHAVEMLILRYEHNYSDVEIGKLLGKSRGVVAVTLHRARARLKKLLRPASGEKP